MDQKEFDKFIEKDDAFDTKKLLEGVDLSRVMEELDLEEILAEYGSHEAPPAPAEDGVWVNEGYVPKPVRPRKERSPRAAVRKEAPLVQKYKEKTEEKQKSVTEELQKAQSTMSAEDFQKKQQQSQQELNIFAASMQRQFMSDIQTNLGEIAKEKEVGIVMVKEAVPNGGIDVTDELIAKLQ